MGVEKNITKEGDGPRPTAGQKVTVHCTGYLPDGSKFWSTKDEGQSVFSFNIGLGQVIRGWDEGVMTMAEGEHATLTVTSDYGYGDRGFPAWRIPGGATLRFDIELLSIA